jgi:hypothetical protein
MLLLRRARVDVRVDDDELEGGEPAVKPLAKPAEKPQPVGSRPVPVE